MLFGVEPGANDDRAAVCIRSFEVGATESSEKRDAPGRRLSVRHPGARDGSAQSPDKLEAELKASKLS